MKNRFISLKKVTTLMLTLTSVWGCSKAPTEKSIPNDKIDQIQSQIYSTETDPEEVLYDKVHTALTLGLVGISDNTVIINEIIKETKKEFDGDTDVLF